jgi:hypothetical protein
LLIQACRYRKCRVHPTRRASYLKAIQNYASQGPNIPEDGEYCVPSRVNARDQRSISPLFGKVVDAEEEQHEAKGYVEEVKNDDRSDVWNVRLCKKVANSECEDYGEDEDEV